MKKKKNKNKKKNNNDDDNDDDNNNNQKNKKHDWSCRNGTAPREVKLFDKVCYCVINTQVADDSGRGDGSMYERFTRVAEF